MCANAVLAVATQVTKEIGVPEFAFLASLPMTFLFTADFRFPQFPGFRRGKQSVRLSDDRIVYGRKPEPTFTNEEEQCRIEGKEVKL